MEKPLWTKKFEDNRLESSQTDDKTSILKEVEIAINCIKISKSSELDKLEAEFPKQLDEKYVKLEFITLSKKPYPAIYIYMSHI